MNDNFTHCSHTPGCCACKDGMCLILKNADFGNKPCPFFKTTEQNEAEKKAVMKRLIALDRQDIFDTYYGGNKDGVCRGC